jgi:hypothetical protein
MTFNPVTEPIDYFELAGTRSPGLAEIVDADSPRRWDERKGYALSGAWLVFKGAGLSKFKAVIRLYTEQDWADWHAFRAILARAPVGSRDKHLAIWHPILEDLGITDVAVLNVLQPKQTGHGEYTIEILFEEFRRPTAQLSRPEAAQARPVDPVEQEIERLTAIANNRRILADNMPGGLAGPGGIL